MTPAYPITWEYTREQHGILDLLGCGEERKIAIRYPLMMKKPLSHMQSVSRKTKEGGWSYRSEKNEGSGKERHQNTEKRVWGFVCVYGVCLCG